MFGFILCLLHSHQWGRLTVFSKDGSAHLYEECSRCGVMHRRASLTHAALKKIAEATS